MKKKLFVFSTVGIAAGLFYALESNRRKQRAELPGEKSSRSRRRAKLLSTDDSAAQTERAGSSAKGENGKAIVSDVEALHPIDSQGTTQEDASRILREIRDTAFEASDEKLALALGRPTEEIEQWTGGNGSIDGDVVMKARALSIQRGLAVE